MQFDPLNDENMKAVLAAEKKVDDIEKRLTENLEELQGIEKVKILNIVCCDNQRKKITLLFIY